MASLSRSMTYAAAAVVCGGGVAQADILPFGQINGYETLNAGDQPAEFHDGDSNWWGHVAVVESGVGGAPLAGPFGGSRFLQITPDGSDAPYAHLGAQQSYPGGGNRYAFVVDIYTAGAAGVSGSFAWVNGVNDIDVIGNGDTVGEGDIVMTEAGFNFTPGETGWSVIARGVPASSFSLEADTWYTFEVIFDRSGPTVTATHNIYAQGGLGGPALHSVTSTPDDDRFVGTQGAPSADMGGPRYSWFTNWGANTVDSIYVDNMGVVPEPASLSLLAIGGVALLRRR